MIYMGLVFCIWQESIFCAVHPFAGETRGVRSHPHRREIECGLWQTSDNTTLTLALEVGWKQQSVGTRKVFWGCSSSHCTQAYLQEVSKPKQIS